MMDFINCIGGFLLAWVAVFFCLGTFKLRGMMKQTHGEPIDATIIKRYPEPSAFYGSVEGQSRQHYMLTFRYKYNDIEYKEQQVVSKNYYTQHGEGSVVAATLDPSKPEKVILAENSLYKKQEYAKARILFLLGTLGLLLLVSEIYFVAAFKK